jgi:hypothetical protein
VIPRILQISAHADALAGVRFTISIFTVFELALEEPICGVVSPPAEAGHAYSDSYGKLTSRGFLMELACEKFHARAWHVT